MSKKLRDGMERRRWRLKASSVLRQEVIREAQIATSQMLNETRRETDNSMDVFLLRIAEKVVSSTAHL